MIRSDIWALAWWETLTGTHYPYSQTCLFCLSSANKVPLKLITIRIQKDVCISTKIKMFAAISTCLPLRTYEIAKQFIWSSLGGLYDATYHRKIYSSIDTNRGGSRRVIGALAPLKPTKVTFFTMILNNSENSIRDIRPFYRPFFCHSSVVKYTSSFLQ